MFLEAVQVFRHQGTDSRAQGSAGEAPSQQSPAVLPAANLPKGGGAIRGIGEQFAANPVNCSSSMSAPIYASPGPSGFGPQLALRYDSGSGSGPFGFGRSLSIPAITRKTDKCLPRYQDVEESDVSVLSGAEDLVPVLGGHEDTSLSGRWQEHGARFVVPPTDHDDLRKVIEGPASVRVLHFEPYELVDELIGEVIQPPGALPLLSFTLSELYDMYLRQQAKAPQRGETIDRSLTEGDDHTLGGVAGSLHTRATEEHDRLPDEAHQQTMQHVMLRMVAVEGGEPARRQLHLYPPHAPGPFCRAVWGRAKANEPSVAWEMDG